MKTAVFSMVSLRAKRSNLSFGKWGLPFGKLKTGFGAKNAPHNDIRNYCFQTERDLT